MCAIMAGAPSERSVVLGGVVFRAWRTGARSGEDPYETAEEDELAAMLWLLAIGARERPLVATTMTS